MQPGHTQHVHVEDKQGQRQPRGLLQSRTGVVLVCFLAIAAFFLITEHAAHVFGALPYLLLLACPLLHVFMHRGGHGSHDGDDRGSLV